MALKVVKAAQIVNEYEDKIKTRALPENVNLDVMQQSLDVVREILKQSAGKENVSFNDYRQFRQYLAAVNQLQAISKGMDVKQATELGFIPFKSLNDLVKQWRERKQVMYIPRAYAEQAVKNFRVFGKSFTPVEDFKVDMEKFSRVLEDLLRQVAERNKEKGEEIKNVVIDPRELTQLQRQAFSNVRQWYQLTYDPNFRDPKYQFSVADLQDLFRVATAPRQPSPEAKLEEEIAEAKAKALKAQGKVAEQAQADQAQRPTSLQGIPITGGALSQQPLGPQGVNVPGQQVVVAGQPLPGQQVPGQQPTTAQPGMAKKASPTTGLAPVKEIPIQSGAQQLVLQVNPNLNPASITENSPEIVGALNALNPRLAEQASNIFYSNLSGGWNKALQGDLASEDEAKLQQKIDHIEELHEKLSDLRKEIAALQVKIYQKAILNQSYQERVEEQEDLLGEFNKASDEFAKESGEEWSAAFEPDDLKSAAKKKYQELHPGETIKELETEKEEEEKKIAQQAKPATAPGAQGPTTGGAQQPQAATGREKDYYKIFGLSPSATTADINKRFQELQDQYRYAATSGNAALMQELQDIHEAFGTLSDTQKKVQYDQGRAQTQVVTQPTAPQQATTAQPAPSQGGLGLPTIKLAKRKQARQKRAEILQQVWLGRKSPLALFSMPGLEDEDSITLAIRDKVINLKNRVVKKTKQLMIKGTVGLLSFGGRSTKRIAGKIDVTLRKAIPTYRKLSVKVRLGKAGLKKAKQSRKLLRFVVNAFFRNTVGKIAETIKDVTKTVGRVSGISKAVTNMKTAQYLAQKVGQYVPAIQKGVTIAKEVVGKVLEIPEAAGIKVKAGFQLVKTFGGRVATFVSDTGQALGNVFKGLPKGALAGIGGLIVTGTLPGAVAGFAAGTAVGTVNNVLANQKLSNFKWLRGIQERYGWGQFQNKMGWRLDANTDPKLAQELAKRSNIFGNRVNSFARVIRGINTGLSGGTIGAIIGGLTGNPLAGAAIGLGTGFIGRQFLDSRTGVKIAGALKNGLPQNLFQRLAGIPTYQIINQIQGTNWFINQINRIREDYKGDLNKYLSENFTGVSGLFNGISAFSYVQSTFLSARIFLRGLINMTQATSTLGTALRSVRLTPTSIGAAAGAIIGTAASAILGIPIGGIGAAIAGTAGGIIGGLIGASIAGSISAGILVPIGQFLGSAIGSFLGTTVGSLFDRTVGRVVNSLMGVVQGIQTLFNLISFLREGFSVDAIIPLVIGLMSITTLISHGSKTSSANNCTQAGTCPAGTSGAGYNYNKYDLNNYGVSIITDKKERITSNSMKTIIETLAEFSEHYNLHNYQKKIVLVIGIDHNYSDQNLVILSITEAQLKNIDELKSSLKNQLTYLIASSGNTKLSFAN